MHKRLHQTTRHTRRLTFERCEPRLTLSGDGGFIQFDFDGYLSLAGNDFLTTADRGNIDSVVVYAAPNLAADSVAPLGASASLSDLRDKLVINRGAFMSAVNNYLDSGHQLTVSFIDHSGIPSTRVLDNPKFSEQDFQDLIEEHLLVDGPASSQVPEPPFEPATLLPNQSPFDLGSTPSFESKTSSALEEETPLASFAIERAGDEAIDDSTLPPITALEALLLARKDAEFKDAAAEPDTLAEGGPIEVDEAVAAAQRAYESELFAEVAAQLDGQHAVAQLDSPDAKPLVGELARAVVFEVVGQESEVDEAVRHDDAHAPSAAVDSDEPAAALAIKNERDENASSRALAFAEWPLYFSAALGGVLATRRRRTHADTMQHPPRRRSGEPLAR